jgi:hypothetical protein
MDNNRTVFHVFPNATLDLWLVMQENGGYRKEFLAKDAAIAHAERLAEEQLPSRVSVHERDGQIEYEKSYGDECAVVSG